MIRTIVCAHLNCLFFSHGNMNMKNSQNDLIHVAYPTQGIGSDQLYIYDKNATLKHNFLTSHPLKE